MKCPACGCNSFYVKDEFDIYEFNCPDGRIEFTDLGPDESIPQISEKTETFCCKCAWHGSYSKIK